MNISPIDLRPFTNEQYALFVAVTSKYLNLNNERGFDRIKPNTCVDLDKSAKEIIDEITKDPNNQLKNKYLTYAKEQVLGKFNRYDCRNKIEETRFDESGKLITENAIKSEQKVLGKSNLENNIYILLGATVLITALVILLKKKK